MPTACSTTHELIQQSQGLVRSVASNVHSRLPASIELDDLIAYGQVGLAEAARDFDPGRSGKFSTYAYYRIRGAIYDGLSKMSWTSRARYRRIRFEQMAGEMLADESTSSAADERGSLEDDARWLRRVAHRLTVVRLATHRGGEDDAAYDLADSHEPGPAVSVAGREMEGILRDLVDRLPRQVATLLRAVYFGGATLQEAGKQLGISKSWASRLHTKGLDQIACCLRRMGADDGP